MRNSWWKLICDSILFLLISFPCKVQTINLLLWKSSRAKPNLSALCLARVAKLVKAVDFTTVWTFGPQELNSITVNSLTAIGWLVLWYKIDLKLTTLKSKIYLIFETKSTPVTLTSMKLFSLVKVRQYAYEWTFFLLM